MTNSDDISIQTAEDDYVKYDVNNYVRKQLETQEVIQAEKHARIIARQGSIGEQVTSWSVDSNGNPIVEKEEQVEIDSVTNQPGWIVTKVDENGEITVDNNGHQNSWIIADSIFKQKYEQDPKNPGLFKPTGKVQLFVPITDNIIITQWGQDMKIARGGYINITNPDDMYGISERDFKDTYKQVKTNSLVPVETTSIQIIEEQAQQVIDQMAKPSIEPVKEESNSKQMGYTMIGILGLVTAIITIGIIVFGVLLFNK